jgi:hypothetical protein
MLVMVTGDDLVHEMSEDSLVPAILNVSAVE